jgi:hypothetical protein
MPFDDEGHNTFTTIPHNTPVLVQVLSFEYAAMAKAMEFFVEGLISG